ncbi:hypothetical protein CH370_12450 [Leptospira kmetyi]|nr:hypothetical protein CH370_12450 [Leptospira kmetyi]
MDFCLSTFLCSLPKFQKADKEYEKHFIRKRKIESGKGKLEDEQDKEKSRNVRDAKSKSD